MAWIDKVRKNHRKKMTKMSQELLDLKVEVVIIMNRRKWYKLNNIPEEDQSRLLEINDRTDFLNGRLKKIESAYKPAEEEHDEQQSTES